VLRQPAHARKGSAHHNSVSKKGNLVRLNKSIVTASLFLLAATVSGGRLHADVPGPHPAYLHALSDLRLARAYLERWSPDEHVDANEQRAIGEIDAAIGEVKHASIDDGKNLDDHPRIDTHIPRGDRFRKAEKLLEKAHHDLDKAEDVPQSRGLRDRALVHIDWAWHATQEANLHGGW
jgi:hypothetical protein